MADAPRAMIYGANGYTGRLIAAAAVARGIRPILAGRNAEAIRELGAKLDCPTDCFSLQQADQVAKRLAGLSVVLNCAGPFSKTARIMIDACLLSGVDYLDITGEIEVIQLAASRDAMAKQAGVALVPAVGFDVVPTDCLAAMLAQRLPGARVLQLAFAGAGGLSVGTAKTALESMPSGGRVRIDGEIRHVPSAWKTMEVPFRTGPLMAVTIPWGDVASAYYSTEIPNIEVYMAMPPGQVARLRRFRFLLPIIGWSPIQALLRRWIERNVPGPSEEERETVRSSFWGRVSNDQGTSVSATLEGPSGYALTTLTATAALERALQGDLPRGFSTPSKALGSEFILQIPNTDICWN